MSVRPHNLESWERKEYGQVAPALDELRRQREACPPAFAVSAAAVFALPDDEQSAVEAHVASCSMCRDLQADFERLEPVGIPARTEDRILEEVRKRAATKTRPAVFGWRLLVPASVAVVVLVVVGIAGNRHGRLPAPGAPSLPPVVVAAPAPPAAPAPRPQLDKPAVKLSMLALTWRGASDGRSFATDVAPALDAFRADRFDEAERALRVLAPHYPTSVEIPFYQGVSLLFLDRPADAIGPLRRASRLADELFAADADWYLGVALQRAGHATEARTRFAALCRGAGAYARRACEEAR